MLVADRQFLLPNDVPIQDRTQQVQICEIFSLPVAHGAMSAKYKISDKYIGITYYKTQAVVITEQQLSTCSHANGKFYKIDTPFQAHTYLPMCIVALYAKNNKEIGAQCSLYFIHHQLSHLF